MERYRLWCCATVRKNRTTIESSWKVEKLPRIDSVSVNATFISTYRIYLAKSMSARAIFESSHIILTLVCKHKFRIFFCPKKNSHSKIAFISFCCFWLELASIHHHHCYVHFCPLPPVSDAIVNKWHFNHFWLEKDRKMEREIRSKFYCHIIYARFVQKWAIFDGRKEMW